MADLTLAIVVGSTRPGRLGAGVAEWVHRRAAARTTATYEIVDLDEVALPLLDEAVPALVGRYEHAHTRDWAREVQRFDGFVFVTPEYNHTTSPALLNALDFVYAEWNDKACGFVSYGTSYGVRAVETLRGVVGELQMADVRGQVRFALPGDFPDGGLRATSAQEADADILFGQLESWAAALRSVRDHR